MDVFTYRGPLSFGGVLFANCGQWLSWANLYTVGRLGVEFWLGVSVLVWMHALRFFFIVFYQSAELLRCAVARVIYCAPGGWFTPSALFLFPVISCMTPSVGAWY
jgi:hypothetical protein